LTPSKIPVAVLGATGTVGQRFVSLLEDHPRFEIAALAASDRSAGRPFGEACAWRLPRPLPATLAAMTVRRVEPDLPAEFVFSALDAETARDCETRFAAAGHAVFSNASAFRMEADVPLVVPEVNPDHLALIEVQRRRRGWSGLLVTNPNCSAVQLAIALAPLDRAFGVVRVLVTTLQSLSGAGYPGVASLDALANVIPDIPGEAEKIERETRRLLGRLEVGGDSVRPAGCAISARTFRVPVETGHTHSVSVELARAASADDLIAAWREFRGSPVVASLPTAPPRPIEFTVIANNTVRGAAGASVLNAELALETAVLSAGRRAS
jgi:aspartate-semialdehyde dehydrogenase